MECPFANPLITSQQARKAVEAVEAVKAILQHKPVLKLSKL